MLDANDIQVLREMFKEEGVRLEAGLDQKLEKQGAKLEKRLNTLEHNLTVKIAQECDRVRNDVIDVINMNIIPQLNRFDARITRLERLQSQA